MTSDPRQRCPDTHYNLREEVEHTEGSELCSLGLRLAGERSPTGGAGPHAVAGKPGKPTPCPAWPRSPNPGEVLNGIALRYACLILHASRARSAPSSSRRGPTAGRLTKARGRRALAEVYRASRAGQLGGGRGPGLLNFFSPRTPVDSAHLVRLDYLPPLTRPTHHGTANTVNLAVRTRFALARGGQAAPG